MCEPSATALRARIQKMSDAQLRCEITDLFRNWCAVSTDPLTKKYYGWLLEESERRRRSGGPDSAGSKPQG